MIRRAAFKTRPEPVHQGTQRSGLMFTDRFSVRAAGECLQQTGKRILPRTGSCEGKKVQGVHKWLRDTFPCCAAAKKIDLRLRWRAKSAQAHSVFRSGFQLSNPDAIIAAGADDSVEIRVIVILIIKDFTCYFNQEEFGASDMRYEIIVPVPFMKNVRKKDSRKAVKGYKKKQPHLI